MTLGARIRELRLAKGLTLQQLAERVRVSGKSTVSSWEQDRSSPRAALFRPLAEALGVEVGALFDRSDAA